MESVLPELEHDTAPIVFSSPYLCSFMFLEQDGVTKASIIEANRSASLTDRRKGDRVVRLLG